MTDDRELITPYSGLKQECKKFITIILDYGICSKARSFVQKLYTMSSILSSNSIYKSFHA